MSNTVRDYTVTLGDRGVKIIKWEGLDGDDTGKPISLAGYSDKTVQLGVYGGNTHGNGTYILQGSNDPVADPNHADHGAGGANAIWTTLVDPQGNAISRTTATLLETVLDNPLWIRPSSSGGTAGDMDVIIVASRTKGN